MAAPAVLAPHEGKLLGATGGLRLNGVAVSRSRLSDYVTQMTK